MRVYDLLTPEMVKLELESVTRDDGIKELVGLLKRKNKISRERELIQKLLQREDLGSTAIGDGVAIPHCKMKGIKNPVVMLSISKRGFIVLATGLASCPVVSCLLRRYYVHVVIWNLTIYRVPLLPQVPEVLGLSLKGLNHIVYGVTTRTHPLEAMDPREAVNTLALVHWES